MATKPELTPVQLAALDLIIAHKKANPNEAFSFIHGIVHAITKVVPVVTKITPVATPVVAGHAATAAKPSQSADAASELDQIENLSLEQLIEVRNKLGHK